MTATQTVKKPQTTQSRSATGVPRRRSSAQAEIQRRAERKKKKKTIPARGSAANLFKETISPTTTVRRRGKGPSGRKTNRQANHKGNSRVASENEERTLRRIGRRTAGRRGASGRVDRSLSSEASAARALDVNEAPSLLGLESTRPTRALSPPGFLKLIPSTLVGDAGVRWGRGRQCSQLTTTIFLLPFLTARSAHLSGPFRGTGEIHAPLPTKRTKGPDSRSPLLTPRHLAKF